ncbi:uncharacterized protein LOC127722682 isoform X2 [Mytilus californianus]|uniref:uncharacterized protein LOC127722682 isoform X2 n=1 Tax=Mytilus californianus TaxID=6549 RepID=UPI002245E20A|nr:uncharacterized protein LOC127722682 isoform X2 [Mytilus californianus]
MDDTSSERLQIETLAAWFLGPKLENIDILQKLSVYSFSETANFRQRLFPLDRGCITEDVRQSEAYKNHIEKLEKELGKICQELQKSPNFASTRIVGLPVSDTTLSGTLGYLADILYNSNNIDCAGGPVTTAMEVEVGEQLCEMLGYETHSTPKPWVHITCGGTVANIEALWAAQNIKFFPLVVRKVIAENPGIALPNNKIYDPEKISLQNITEVSIWNIINMDIDCIVDMAKSIGNHVNGEKLNKMIDKYSLSSLGWYNFMTMYKLKEAPVVICSASTHYSLLKAMVLLGLGKDQLIQVPTDEHGRLNAQKLDKVLCDCEERKISVIAVVSIQGSTEFGAMDPLEDIILLRDKYMKKGLYFSVHADAACGGYFSSILRENIDSSFGQDNPKEKWYDSMLSNYTENQLDCLKKADSITIDPHKYGFVPLSAGAICYRNGHLKHFVKLKPSFIDHGFNESMGVYGVEGSRQSAAVVSVLLSHNVIGLNKCGYGRILEHCLLCSKLMYCNWLTIAKDDDNFVCFPVMPLPKKTTLEYAKTFIKKFIIGKTFEEIIQTKNTLEFLRGIGSDTVMTPFLVNFKRGDVLNDDIEKCNKLNVEIHRRLSLINTRQNNKRKPLAVLRSSMYEDTYPLFYAYIKDMLGLKGTAGIEFLLNFAKNPWIVYNNQVEMNGSIFRQIVLDTIGLITDKPSVHPFLVAGRMFKNTFFCDYLTNLQIPGHQYQAIVKFQFLNASDTEKYRTETKENANKCKRQSNVFMQIDTEMVIGEILESSTGVVHTVSFYDDVPSMNNYPFMSSIKVKVDDIPLFRHVDMVYTVGNIIDDYFLYGDQHRIHMSRKISKMSNCLQVAILSEKPNALPLHWIEQGMDVSLIDLVEHNNRTHEPCIKTKFIIQYSGPDGNLFKQTVQLDPVYGLLDFAVQNSVD